MREDWRQERDRALMALEGARFARDKEQAAQVLVELALEDRARYPELAACVPRLVADRFERVRRSGVALGALVLSPDEAEPFLQAQMKDPSAEVRLEAVGQLADLARPGARGLFAAALEDTDFNVRFEAARGMAALHHPAGYEVLLEGLEKKHLRFRAIGGLAELGDARAIAPLKGLLHRFLLNPFDRVQAAGALAKLGDDEGAQWLQKRVQKQGGMERPLAVELLGEVQRPFAYELLLQVLQDPKDEARGAAARGLGRHGDLAALPQLQAVLHDDGAPEHVRLDVAEGLCALPSAEARALVEAVFARAPEGEFKAELKTVLEEYR